MKSLEKLNFSNSYLSLGDHFHTQVKPSPVSDPYLISFNAEAAALIELEPNEAERPLFTSLFSGNKLLDGFNPLAMRYAGHQFGHYVPQLGDGRAILLGQVHTESNGCWDLHLKGGGPTAYSRGSDGRAVLRSSIREYLCGEAMFHLGIPTSRSLSLIGSDVEVYREQIETAAMIVRLAPSHIRFGSFELFYYQNEFTPLKSLADYVIKHHFPQLLDAQNPVLALLAEVTELTARLMAHWQTAGFAHGVMNTDNMSILGLTLDYGPFGFLDNYDAGFICNHSDHHGRYAFDQQPSIGLWNLSCLAQALLPLLDEDPQQGAEMAKAILTDYQPRYERYYLDLMRAKLGLQDRQANDIDLVRGLLQVMQKNQSDYTILWRSLGTFRTDISVAENDCRNHVVDRQAFDQWAEQYADRLRQEHSINTARQQRMNLANPKYVLRNYLAQAAIEKAERKDYSEVNRLLELLRKPFDEQPEMEAYAAYPPDWAGRLSVSCSS